MKNDKITINITSVTPEGYGIGRSEGKVVFVPDTAIGDVAEVLIIKELKNSSVAKVLNIISPSPCRVESDCAVSAKCGGCVFRHISYEAELDLKRTFVSDALSRIGGLDIPVESPIYDEILRYRNKVQYPFARDGEGKCIFGYYARRSHRIIRHDFCPLQEDIFASVASFCAERANFYGIKAYDEEQKNGILRHAVMRKNKKGEILLCLVVTAADRKLKILCEDVYNNFEKVIGVHLNINKTPGNVIFGDKTEKIIGEDVIEDILCGKKFSLSPRSFYQVNAPMAEKLYLKAKSLAAVPEGSVILDLYCGVGTVGLCVASKEDKLCGVEVIDAAVENAKSNAFANGRNTENTLFVCGDASLGVNECKNKFGDPNIIIVDPPRKGLDIGVINTVLSASPDRVVYISCDPATLARDLEIFSENGYNTDKAYTYDLFPRTGHIETVVCLKKGVSKWIMLLR